MSTTVGPAGSTRFSTRRCGSRRRCRRPGGSSGRSCRCAAAARQRRHAPALEHPHRVLVVGDRQQRREVADVLLEQVEDRGDPALAEPHPGPDALGLELLAAGVGGLLEQRDPGLAPQLLAEQERRVGADGELDAGDRLRGVPVRRELVRATLHVQLGAGAGRLRQDRVGGGASRSGPRDVDVDVLAAGGQDLLADQPVARVGAQRLGLMCPRPGWAGCRSSPCGRRPRRTSPRRR